MFADDVVAKVEFNLFYRELGEEGVVDYDRKIWPSKENYMQYVQLFLETSEILEEEIVGQGAGLRSRQLLLAHGHDFATMCRFCDTFGIDVGRRRLMFEVICLCILFVLILTVYSRRSLE